MNIKQLAKPLMNILDVKSRETAPKQLYKVLYGVELISLFS